MLASKALSEVYVTVAIDATMRPCQSHELTPRGGFKHVHSVSSLDQGLRFEF